MGVIIGPNIEKEGLFLALDARNSKSYPGTGNIWYDLSGNSNNFTAVNGVETTWNSDGYFDFDSASNHYFNLSKSIPSHTELTVIGGAFVETNNRYLGIINSFDSNEDFDYRDDNWCLTTGNFSLRARFGMETNGMAAYTSTNIFEKYTCFGARVKASGFVNFYINGVEDTTGDTTFSLADWNNHDRMLIGARWNNNTVDTSNDLNGKLYFLYIWHRYLDENYVKNLTKYLSFL
jgi:hypothetical protein